jgi:hypothetical protein
MMAVTNFLEELFLKYPVDTGSIKKLFVFCDLGI